MHHCYMELCVWFMNDENMITIIRVGLIRLFPSPVRFWSFLTKNRRLGFPRFGFCTLTVNLLQAYDCPSSTWLPVVDVASRRQLAFVPLVAWCRMSCVKCQYHIGGRPSRVYVTSYSLLTQTPRRTWVEFYQHMTRRGVKCSYVISYGWSVSVLLVTIK